MYDHVTWRRMSPCIDPTYNWEYDEEEEEDEEEWWLFYQCGTTYRNRRTSLDSPREFCWYTTLDYIWCIPEIGLRIPLEHNT